MFSGPVVFFVFLFRDVCFGLVGSFFQKKSGYHLAALLLSNLSLFQLVLEVQEVQLILDLLVCGIRIGSVLEIQALFPSKRLPDVFLGTQPTPNLVIR